MPDADQCLVVISDKLANVIGTEDREMIQDDVLKHIWNYIKANQLEVSITLCLFFK